MDQPQSRQENSDTLLPTREIFRYSLPLPPLPEEESFQNFLQNLLNENELALSVLKAMEPSFTEKFVFKTRRELADSISSLEMSEERKSYFLHQLVNVHSLLEMQELFHVINNDQKESPRKKRDFMFFSYAQDGIKWSHRVYESQKVSFSILGIVEDFPLEQFLSEKIGKLTILHHTPIDCSKKFQDFIRSLLNEILKSTKESNIHQTVKKHWTNQPICDFLALSEVKDVLDASSDLTYLKESDVVLLGPSSYRNFLTADLFKKHAIILDTSHFL